METEQSSLLAAGESRPTGNDEAVSARQEIIHHFSRRFPQSDVVVAFALVRELCDPLLALSHQHPSLCGEKFEYYSTYFLASAIWAVVVFCGPAECDDNDPTDGAACAMGRAFHAWKRSEDENLRRYVEKNLPWPQIAKKLKTERAVRQRWKLLGRRSSRTSTRTRTTKMEKKKSEFRRSVNIDFLPVDC